MDIDVVAEENEDVLSTDNLPTAEVLSKYRLARHFTLLAVQAVLAKCVPGVNASELCQIGDATILAQVGHAL
jgi:methionine aminopeptidase